MGYYNRKIDQNPSNSKSEIIGKNFIGSQLSLILFGNNRSVRIKITVA